MVESMNTIDPDELGEYLSAYLDDELSAAERQVVEQALARDPTARRQLEELRQTVGLVQSLPRRAAPPSLLQDLTAAAERRQLLGEPVETERRRRPWWLSGQPWLAAAAALIVMVVGGYYVFQYANQPAERMAERTAPPPSLQPAAPVPSPSEGHDDVAMAARPAPAGARARQLQPGDLGRMAAVADADTRAKEMLDIGTPPDARSTQGGSLDTRLADDLGMARSAAPSAESADTPAADRQAQIALAPTLTWDQKSAVQVACETLVNHPFSNESNQLIVAVESARDAELAESQFAAWAVANDVRDVSKLAATQPAAPPAAEALYLEGRPGVNYEPDGTKEILVQTPVHLLPELVEALRPAGDRARAMELAVGPLVASGDQEIDTALVQMQRVPQARAYLAEPEQAGLADGKKDASAQAHSGEAAPSGAAGLAGAAPAEERQVPTAKSEVRREVEPAKEAISKWAGGAAAPASRAEARPTDKDATYAGAGATSRPTGVVGGLLQRLVNLGADAGRGGAAASQPPRRAPAPATFRPGELVNRSRRQLESRERQGQAAARGRRAGQDESDSYGLEPLVTLVVRFEETAPTTTAPASAEETAPAGPASPDRTESTVPDGQ